MTTQVFDDGSRASFPDDDGKEFQIGPPAPGHEQIYSRGIAAVRAAMAGESADSTDVVQPELDGMPEEPAKPDRHAFGGFLKSHLYEDAVATPKVELEEGDLERFVPGKLKRVCYIPVGVDEYNSVYRFNGILLSPQERTTLVRSPKLLGRTAFDRTLSAREEQTDEDISAGMRSIEHVRTNKIEAMTTMKAGMEQRKRDVEELLGEAKSPGYAHKRAERMHQLFSAAWEEILNLTDTLQAAEGFDDASKLRLRQAAKDYLTTGPQRERVMHWKELLDFQKEYLRRKIHIFDQQIKLTEDATGEQSQSLETAGV